MPLSTWPSPRRSPGSPTGQRRRTSWPGDPARRAGAGDRVVLAQASDPRGQGGLPRPGLPRHALRHGRGLGVHLRQRRAHRAGHPDRAVQDDDSPGFLADEGLARCLAIMSTVAGRPAYTRKMAWLMPRMAKAVPYLGYTVIAGTKPG